MKPLVAARGALVALALALVTVEAAPSEQALAGEEERREQSGAEHAPEWAAFDQLVRHRRQATTSGQYQAAQAQQNSPSFSSFLSELGPQVERAQSSMKMLTSLFNTGGSAAAPANGQSGDLQQQLASAFGQQQAPSGGQSALTQSLGAAQLMSQLSDLIRSTQDRNAKLVASAQQNVEATGQQSAQAAKSAQGGIQSALAEIGAGLQRIASNNPNLLPDIKNLYQSVSSKLSSASSSVAQAAQPAALQPAPGSVL